MKMRADGLLKCKMSRAALLLLVWSMCLQAVILLCPRRMRMGASMLWKWKTSRVALLFLFLICSVGSLTVSNCIQQKDMLPQISLGVDSAEGAGTYSDGLYSGRDADVYGFGIQGLGDQSTATHLRFHRFPSRPGHGSSETGRVTTQNYDGSSLHSTRYNPSADGNALPLVVPHSTHKFQKRSRRLVRSNPDLNDDFTEDIFSRDYAHIGMNPPIIQDPPNPPNPPRTGLMEIDYEDPKVHPPGNAEP